MSRRLTIFLVAVPAALVLAVVGWFVADEVMNDHEVPRNVVAGEVDLTRLSPTQAVEAMAAYEQELASTPLTVEVEGTQVIVDPAAIGLSLDEEAVVAEALATRPDRFWSVVGDWFASWFTEATIDVPVEVDDEALDDLIDGWTRELVAEPAFEGAVQVVDFEAVPEYPQAGRQVDREAVEPLLVEALGSTVRGEPIVAPITILEPEITDADVDEAVAVAAELIDDTVILVPEEGIARLVYGPAVLADLLQSEVVRRSPARLEVSLDADRLQELVADQAELFTIDPVDATFEFDQETKEITIVPSEIGKVLDLEALPEVVTEAALGSGTAAVPLTDGAEPSFTTEDAEAMGPLGEVSSFTTTHSCCESRVTNIQLMADYIDGSIVMPGEVFSVNETVGQRTRAKGFVAAGAIIGGRVECCDSPINIGGGTSQFATTMYNAMYFGCYEDVFHQPHSIYFSRYPFIREATIGFPAPDLQWRNDTDAVAIVDTSYTPTSITVTIYGNNGGRICESETSGNTNTRIMTFPDGTVERQSWTWNYRPELPPETTTTTAPATTTTVATPPPASSSTSSSTTSTTTTTTVPEEGGGGEETP